MKKLDLKLDSIKEMLSKEQMKKITGGESCYSGYCGTSPPTSYWTCDNSNGYGRVAAVCSPYNPFFGSNVGDLYLYYRDPYDSTQDGYCIVGHCTF